MNNLEWYDWLRMITAIATISAMYRLAERIRHREQVYSPRLKDFLWLIFATLTVILIGALEALAQDSPYRYTIILSFFVSLVAVRATRKDNHPLIT